MSGLEGTFRDRVDFTISITPRGKENRVSRLRLLNTIESELGVKHLTAIQYVDLAIFEGSIKTDLFNVWRELER